jgi:hypothetical protein
MSELFLVVSAHPPPESLPAMALVDFVVIFEERLTV